MPEEIKSVLANQKIVKEQIASITNDRITATLRKNAVQEITQRLEVLLPEDWDMLVERSLMFGKPALALVKCQDRVRTFIEQAKIEPIVAQNKYIDGGLIHGIIAHKYLHVHIADQLYLLDKAQARSLNQALVNDLGVNLEQAGVIKF